MGSDIAVDLVFHGLEVVLVDISDECLQKAEGEVVKSLRFAPLLHKNLPKLAVKEALQTIRFTTHMAEVADCDFVIENVTEDWQVKKEVYTRLDGICPGGVCFGVDTSCLSITKIAGVTRRPDRVIGMHFMNPSYLKPIIEVMKGYHTSEETISTCTALLKVLGKEAIIVHDYPGFVSNRISHLFMNEAAFVLQDGVATAEQIDRIFKGCFSHKMGPLETADLIGLDTVMKSLEVLYESYQDPKFRCCPLLKKLVDAGHLGRKAGKGFHDYKKSS